jgi:glutathionyl-hydroquinone reductase
LQHLIGIFEEVAELVSLGAKRFGRKLRRHLDSSNGRIFRDITNFVYLDAGFAGERGLQLLG